MHANDGQSHRPEAFSFMKESRYCCVVFCFLLGAGGRNCSVNSINYTQRHKRLKVCYRVTRRNYEARHFTHGGTQTARTGCVMQSCRIGARRHSSRRKWLHAYTDTTSTILLPTFTASAWLRPSGTDTRKQVAVSVIIIIKNGCVGDFCFLSWWHVCEGIYKIQKRSKIKVGTGSF